MGKAFLIFFLMSVICNAHAASFDCSVKNLAPIELMICNDPDLSEIDSLLSVYYKYALTNSKEQKDLKYSQRDWIKQRNNCANDYLCIANSYEDRITELAKKSNLLSPEHVINPQLFTAAHMLATGLGDFPSCGSFKDINLDGKEEVTCLPDCNGAPACSDYFFVSQSQGYKYLPELEMGSYDELSVVDTSAAPIPALEKQQGYKNNTINGWRILSGTYGDIRNCTYEITYYAYSEGAYHQVISESLTPPFKGCEE